MFRALPSSARRLRVLLLPAFILLVVFQASPAIRITETDVDGALEALDRSLEGRSGFIAMRQARIDTLVAALDTVSRRLPVLMSIADEYTSFNNDSALTYLSRAIEEAKGSAEALPFRWKYASLLPLAGFFETAAKEFAAIPADSVPRHLLASYYDSGRQMHSYIAAFYQAYPDIYAENSARALDFQRKLLKVLSKNSPAYKFNLGEYYFMNGDKLKAQTLLSEIVSSEPPESNLRARAAHHLSTLAREAGDDNASLYYLALSADADVLAATREVLSLQELGTRISNDDINRAHRYLSTALENAVECGAALRMVDTSRSLPVIEKAHTAHIMAWRRMIYFVIVCLAVLMAVLIATLLILRKEMRKMRKLELGLRNANKVKEVYISRFLQLCSIYMDKLNQFCKIATRKLAAGQADDLYRMTRSGKFVEEQSREFYEVFDGAFLHLYPDFVEDVNKLMRPDARIELKQGEQLNTDLRILAFMRLGIEDSPRIAQVLNYSLNTIYAYRNRLKARAIDRDNFEADIMKIGSVD